MKQIGNDYSRIRRVIIKCPGCRVQRSDAALRFGFDWLVPVAIKNWNERPGDQASPEPPPGCDRGTMFNQNLPEALCTVGWRVDSTLPPGTLEVWKDGQRIGRIENIGRQ